MQHAPEPVDPRRSAAHARSDRAHALATRIADSAQTLQVLAARLAASGAPDGGLDRRLIHWHGLVEVAIAAFPVDLTAATPPSLHAASEPAERSRWAFRRAGDTWVIGRGPVFHLRDSKGLAYLATLFAAPGREFHALDLVRSTSFADGVASTLADAADVQRRSSSIDQLLDPRAAHEYRARLGQVQTEIAEAEAANDWHRATEAKQEADWLRRELGAAYGLGDRARGFPSPAERARQSVTKAIRAAIERIRAEDRELAGHIDHSVRTGRFCAYDPDPASAPFWDL